MSYTALYRKFRPATFDEVKGQDHIVKTLRNQIRADRMGHAYLFCGTRGTGKTSVAKIFAKAVNCEHPVDGNPCGECASCRAIAVGTAMNVIEIDAASNNGVDDVRQIREEVSYSPTEGRFKVYIIDEVHMLSNAAFNALLKTLEEPPSYVIFILATTEAQKIPITILSRCQRYDFRRISQETILARLQELMAEEQVDAEEKALRYVARKGDGSLRDSLSLLDQCIAFYMGETLTYDRVLEVLGAVDTDVYSDLLRKILRGDLAGAIRTLEQLIMQGSDLTQFVNDFTWYMRNLMLMKASDDMEEVLDVSAENLAQLREESAMIRSDTLMRYIRIFSELANSLRNSTNKRVQVEMALIKLCHPETESDELSVLERIRRIEKAMANREAVYGMPSRPAAEPRRGGDSIKIEQGAFVPGGVPGQAGMLGATGYAANGVAGHDDGTSGTAGYGTGGAGYGTDAAGYGTGGAGYGTGAAAASLPKAAPEDLKKVCGMWKNIIGGTDGMFKIVLSSATPKYNSQDEKDTRLYVVFADFLGERYLNNAERKQELEQLIAERTGKQVEVKFVLAADQGIQRGSLSKIEIDEMVREQVHMDIEIVEDEE
ncbi:MAG: DNA polymerase III subunit gamma/tau [Lachnospiraceae bacterium]|nr:DNA polymerase III subunit gamma/tau [Lachnospiraceae bacterium]